MSLAAEVTTVLNDVGVPVYASIVPAEQNPPYLVWTREAFEPSYTLDGRRQISAVPISIQLWADQHQQQRKEELATQVLERLDTYESDAIRLIRPDGRSDVYAQDTGFVGVEFTARFFTAEI